MAGAGTTKDSENDEEHRHFTKDGGGVFVADVVALVEEEKAADVEAAARRE